MHSCIACMHAWWNEPCHCEGLGSRSYPRVFVHGKHEDICENSKRYTTFVTEATSKQQKCCSWLLDWQWWLGKWTSPWKWQSSNGCLVNSTCCFFFVLLPDENTVHKIITTCSDWGQAISSHHLKHKYNQHLLVENIWKLDRWPFQNVVKVIFTILRS